MGGIRRYRGYISLMISTKNRERVLCMGGPGSGRWYRWQGTRTTLEEVYRLDVRWLHRHGYLDGRPIG